ncbi:hypothetical protein Dfri01_46900 [Dyadobacter frigoris]|uniref:SDR family NAD(P)-dependent oxidoreductase n=1 Tax=Dyadobacter frigoris TaxID=2576211 RepID=UPI0024A23497|nr:SDR family NAD(P)-dependent oxidoreductase [Dyadobacter frigoris]GLU55229.1 hypothetical protein Dfri01_46900 [Dyadobacter frigoris]
MNNPKVWAVLGAMDGLGSAAIKYLVTSRQIVIAFVNKDFPGNTLFDKEPENLYIIPLEAVSEKKIKNALTALISKYGAIDFIINNSNYKLFNDSIAMTSEEIESVISTDVSITITLLKAIIPYLRKEPKGSLINIPPQLCLAIVADKTAAERLACAMEYFLKTLQVELMDLDCNLSFLQPGERFANFAM